ncbi:MAG: NUDIX domain-containing protein [Rhodothermia bacterium]|nr:NUDIX domain-containing protein [Rhodothermia bacterium]
MNPVLLVFIRFLLRIRSVFYWLFRPLSVRVRGIVLNYKEEVLLIRHPYDDRFWYLPGGGIKRKERFSDALHRELNEELGFEQLQMQKLVGVYTDLVSYRSDVVVVILARTTELPKPNKWEIKEARFFALDALPPNLARSTRERLSDWLSPKEVYAEKW